MYSAAYSGSPSNLIGIGCSQPLWWLHNGGNETLKKSSVSDGLEMLLLDIIALNLYFLLEINETKRNDLWLNFWLKAIICSLLEKYF